MDKEKALALFAEADEYNWDDGLDRVKQMLDDENCELGTASLLYWRTDPSYYKKFASKEEAQPYQQPYMDLIADLETRIAAGAFPCQYVSFDPRKDQIIDDNDPMIKKIPEVMLKAVVAPEGEEYK